MKSGWLGAIDGLKHYMQTLQKVLLAKKQAIELLHNQRATNQLIVCSFSTLHLLDPTIPTSTPATGQVLF